MSESTILHALAVLAVAVFVFLVGRAVVRRVQRGGFGVLLVGIAIGGLLVLALQVGPAIQSRLASIVSIGALLR